VGYKKGDDVTKTPFEKVAEHKDLKDKGQTVKVVSEDKSVIGPGPKTGDSNRLRFFAVLFGGALTALTGFAMREGVRSIRQRREDLNMLV
jgi:hypothetical protein